MLPMAMASKAMASVLLCLLLVHSGLVPSVVGSDDDCWVLDNVYYIFCLKTAKCRSSCLAHGGVDGRCNGSFPYLWPSCECRRPNCTAQAPSPSPSDALPPAN
ncbi:hypothetical protein ACP70R_039788 [Stipagrostis hirtigluma subsp. patula]